MFTSILEIPALVQMLAVHMWLQRSREGKVFAWGDTASLWHSWDRDQASSLLLGTLWMIDTSTLPSSLGVWPTFPPPLYPSGQW